MLLARSHCGGPEPEPPAVPIGCIERRHTVSTHNGDDNPFNTLVNDIRAGRLPYSLHRTTFDDALRDGLYHRVCQRLEIEWTAENEAKWAADIRAQYGDDAEEELDCIPKNGSGSFLTRELVGAETSRVSSPARCLTHSPPAGGTFKKRQGECPRCANTLNTRLRREQARH